MTVISPDRIRQIESRFAELEARMASGEMDGDAFVAASREYAEMEPVAQAGAAIQALRDELTGLEDMLAGDDAELKAMAADEVDDVRRQIDDAEKALSILLLPRDTADDRPAMIEIRAGTGGDEAALFAGDLYRMYERYAALQGWNIDMISANAADVGGFKEVVASINGKGVFAKLKFESGVHRVQRVPETESGGRIHTSAATVAILPEPEEVDIDIRQEDLRIDTYRASGAGGQHVNKTDSAIRITHLPTGLVVTCQDGKSQHKNKAQAMKVLGIRLYEKEREEAQSEEAEARKSMVGSGDRSERIRTYNYPQGRVTDHRINLTLQKLPTIIAGEGLGEMVDALIAEDQAKRLAGLAES